MEKNNEIKFKFCFERLMDRTTNIFLLELKLKIISRSVRVPIQKARQGLYCKKSENKTLFNCMVFMLCNPGYLLDTHS